VVDLILRAALTPQERALFGDWAAGVRPPEQITPSEWAVKYRRLSASSTTKPGRWTRLFPYLDPIMDGFGEALDTGKDGVCLMKSAQGGGSEACQNFIGYYKTNYTPNILYVTSKDAMAEEFGRSRFDYMCRTAEPLAKNFLPTASRLLIKRFTDGKIVLSGPAVSNIQSESYGLICYDEMDSIGDSIGDGSDLVDLGRARSAAIQNQDDCLILAFAHPTTKERGTGKLYYEQSDMRRAHIECPHCGEWGWLQWDNVKPPPGGDDHSPAAEWGLWQPCCGAELTDGQRFAACKNTKQISTIEDPEERARRTWIGLHFSAMYQENKPLSALVRQYQQALGNRSKLRVFFNKVMGDCWAPQQKTSDKGDWQALISHPRKGWRVEPYLRGQAPDGVQFLTAGQDSGATELHYAIWGWGLLRDSKYGHASLCGWLIDWGVVPRHHTSALDASELRVFDELIYGAQYPSTDGTRFYTVRQAFHDAGWRAVAVYEYARTSKRAYPSRGSASRGADTAKLIRWRDVASYSLDGETFKDPGIKFAELNTHEIKIQISDMVEQRLSVGGLTMPRLSLPLDVDQEYIEQSTAERLQEVKGGKLQWVEVKPANHYGDCGVYAYASAHNLKPFLKARTLKENQKLHAAERVVAERAQRERRSQGQKPVQRMSPRNKRRRIRRNY